jgi:hypothetical protein
MGEQVPTQETQALDLLCVFCGGNDDEHDAANPDCPWTRMRAALAVLDG